MQDRLRAILAEEYEKADLNYQAAVVRGEEGGAPSHEAVLTIILDAMRRAYLMGRDDANADADAAENESIEQMDDDASPSNPG